MARFDSNMTVRRQRDETAWPNRWPARSVYGADLAMYPRKRTCLGHLSPLALFGFTQTPKRLFIRHDDVHRVIQQGCFDRARQCKTAQVSWVVCAIPIGAPYQDAAGLRSWYQDVCTWTRCVSVRTGMRCMFATPGTVPVASVDRVKPVWDRVTPVWNQKNSRFLLSVETNKSVRPDSPHDRSLVLQSLHFVKVSRKLVQDNRLKYKIPPTPATPGKLRRRRLAPPTYTVDTVDKAVLHCRGPCPRPRWTVDTGVDTGKYTVDTGRGGVVVVFVQNFSLHLGESRVDYNPNLK